MELVKELFVTGFIAFVFSFLVAKLVSIVMSGDDPSKPPAVREADFPEFEQDLHFSDRLQVQGTKPEEVTATPKTVSEPGIIEKFRPEELETAPETRIEEEAGDRDDGVSVASAAPDNDEEAAETKVEGGGGEEGGRDEVAEKEVEIEDDWEGIEKSELEEAFGRAARLVGSGEEEARLGGEAFQLELYGLHKVATEGPCRENPPLALKLSARSKWNAWQRLGNMTPEVAMEQYVALVSERVPEWMEEKMNKDTEARSSEAANPVVLAADSAAVSFNEVNVTRERDVKLRPDPEKSLTEGLSAENRVKE